MRSIRIAFSPDEDVTLQAELLAEDECTVSDGATENFKLFRSDAGTLILLKTLESKTVFCLFFTKPTVQVNTCVGAAQKIRDELLKLFPRKAGG